MAQRYQYKVLMKYKHGLQGEVLNRGTGEPPPGYLSEAKAAHSTVALIRPHI